MLQNQAALDWIGARNCCIRELSDQGEARSLSEALNRSTLPLVAILIGTYSGSFAGAIAAQDRANAADQV